MTNLRDSSPATEGADDEEQSPPARTTLSDSSRRRATSPFVARDFSRRANADALYIPLALFFSFLLLYALTATSAHTFDGIAYIRDMGKPLAAMVLPHHLIYEPAILGFFNLWTAFGWNGHADLPAQILSSLAGAGGGAVFYKLAWEVGSSRAAALISTLALALSYGYWFYSVEVEIYVPPLFFLLVATWLLGRAVRGGPTYLFWLLGLCHAVAALIHQASLFIIPAFALGILLIPGGLAVRLGRMLRYGVALGGVIVPAYLLAGMVVAGQNTPQSFLKWINSYGNLGTWGVWRRESLDLTASGLSAAVSSGFWVGRLLVVALLVLVIARAVPITRRGGPLAWTLWAWFATYGLFFAWWQPENLKFWVLMLPAPILLAVMAFDWKSLSIRWRNLAFAAGVSAVALLALTDAPTIWAKRDTMADPARQVSDALARLTQPEDLIVLQAGSAEHYLPFYYNRINVMSTRELWYTSGGASGRSQAADAIKRRLWHALAKGSSVWLEDRVLATGAQTSDHYVFSTDEIERLLSPYGERAEPEKVQAGPELFYKLSPDNAFSPQPEWQFDADQAGWSGVNIAGERTGNQGWCFTPLNDPNLYGPPVRLAASEYTKVELQIASATLGKAQIFYRADPARSYDEAQSLTFDLQTGEQLYILDLKGAPGWAGTIRGLRFDPIEQGNATGSASNNICLKSIRVLKPFRFLVDTNSDT